jgi:hypothetical protein
VDLFLNFKHFLSKEVHESQSIFESNLKITTPATHHQPSQDNDDLIYVKHWRKRAKGTIFCLSNSQVQVAFRDNTELLIDKKAQKVFFVS